MWDFLKTNIMENIVLVFFRQYVNKWKSTILFNKSKHFQTSKPRAKEI